MSRDEDQNELTRSSSNDVNNIENDAHSEPQLRHRGSFLSFGHIVQNCVLASRWVSISGQIWSRTIPNDEYEVIVIFAPSATESTLLWIKSLLQEHVPELHVDIKFLKHSQSWSFFVTASYNCFLKGAEDVHLKKTLKEEYGGGLKEFVCDERDYYLGVDDKEQFLSSQERQFIILDILNGIKSNETDLPLQEKFPPGLPIISTFLQKNIISQIFPLHDNAILMKLRETWVQAVFQYQPLDAVCEYFGVKIAMYFSWLGHYTQALVIPACFGFYLWLMHYGSDQTSEDFCFILFALFNVLWATLYLESWKRSCSELAYHWGTLDSENDLLLHPRPSYSGELCKSPVTGRMETMYPTWKRNIFRYFISIPAITLSLFVAFLTMFLIFELQEWWDQKINMYEYPTFLKLFPKIVLAFAITLLDGIYSQLAYWLNDKENYRLEEEYENHLIIKLVLFQFVNSFLSLFYIAFYLQDMERLKEQLAALMITRQVFGNIKESLVPFCIETFKLAHMAVNTEKTEGSGKKKSFMQVEVESSMYKYSGTFEDYLEMFIQFGYVVLFSSAFPLAAFFALMNNVIEIRSDAFKLCVISQRPFGQKASNIGSWQDAMELLGVIAVIVNCALIGVSGNLQRFFPDMTPLQVTLVIVILEHIILFFKFSLAYAIPDVPQWVATEVAKIEFQRREAAKKIQRSEMAKKKLVDKRNAIKSESAHKVLTNAQQPKEVLA